MSSNVFEKLITRGKILMTRMENQLSRGVQSVPADERVVDGEVDGWFRAAAEAIDDAFGANSSEAQTYHEKMKLEIAYENESMKRGDPQPHGERTIYRIGYAIGLIAKYQYVPTNNEHRENIVINIKGSVGILNTGDMSNINSISMSISALQKAGEDELAKALISISEAVLETSEIAEAQRSEILEQLDELGRQASLSPKERMKPGVLKSLLSGISEAIGTVGAAASAWATWGGPISKFFGI